MTTITSFRRDIAPGVRIAILSNGRIKHVSESARVGDVVEKTFEQIVESQVNVLVQPQDGDPETITELAELQRSVQAFCNTKQKPVVLKFHNIGSATDSFTYHPVKPKTREEIRDIARKHGIKRGRNTADTIANLKAAGVKY